MVFFIPAYEYPIRIYIHFGRFRIRFSMLQGKAGLDSFCKASVFSGVKCDRQRLICIRYIVIILIKIKIYLEDIFCLILRQHKYNITIGS